MEVTNAGTGTIATRNLFGGAIQANIPACFGDVSEVRQVPDNQEVLVHPDSDQSVIVELLEAAPEADENNAATYHFNLLAKDNSAEEPTVEYVGEPVKLDDGKGTVTQCYGVQTVSKFNEKSSNKVRVFVAVFRLTNNTDMVLSVNSPVAISSESSSADVVTEQVSQETGLAIFNEAVKTLKVVDYGLFGR